MPHLLTPSTLQMNAIQATGLTVLKACPGSGKTFVVANKMINDVSNWKERNRGIALLSFTNVASDELLSQIEIISGYRDFGYPHFIGTIDSFIYQWLYIPFGYLIMRCTKKPSLLHEASQSMAIYANKIWRRECFSSGCNPFSFYFDFNGEFSNDNIYFEKCPINGIKPCYTFTKYCYDNGYCNYTGATNVAYKLLLEYPQIGWKIAKRFPEVIIDEAQDTSQLQMNIIDKMVEYGLNHILIIGDPDQAIYEWRDADPSIFINKFNNGDWNRKLLNENYRCSQLICNATKIFSTLDDISLSTGESFNYPIKPIIIKYDNRANVIKQFLQLCQDKAIDISLKNVAVLVRGQSGLFDKDYSQIDNLWHNNVSRMFAEAAYERDEGSISRALKKVEKAMFELLIFQDTREDFEYYKRIESRMPIDVWNKMIIYVLKSLPSSTIDLADWRNKADKILKEIILEFMGEGINGKIIDIKSRDKYCPDFLLRPVKCFFANYIRGDFYNGTIHSVKSRSFDAVLLIIGTHGKLTANMINNSPIESEPIRTAYVAMTRARKLLVVAIPSTVKGNALSRFSKEHWNFI